MVGLGPGNIVLDADPATTQGAQPPRKISAHVCCDQTAGWIKMPLGTKVGLGPGRIVLHGDPATPPLRKGAQAPNFRPMSIVDKRLPISATAEHLFCFVATARRPLQVLSTQFDHAQQDSHTERPPSFRTHWRRAARLRQHL